MALRAVVAVLAGGARGTDVTRGAVAASGTGWTCRTRVTRRADGSGGTLVNGNSQDVVEAQTNVLVSCGARRGPDGRRRCRANGFCHPFSWVFMFFCRFKSVRFGRFRH